MQLKREQIYFLRVFAMIVERWVDSQLRERVGVQCGSLPGFASVRA